MSADEPQKPLTHQKLLTILIEFNDVKIKMGSDFWNKEMFDTTPGKLSVVNYWKENSNGLDIFEPADTSGIEVGRKGTVSYEDYTDIAYEIIARADGVVRISLDIPHPTPTGSEGKNGLHKAVIMVIGALEENDFDFTAEKSHIVTIFAGYGQSIAQGTVGKGHFRAYTSATGVETPGGIMLDPYTAQPEMYSLDIHDGIGTICHELGHSVFKLPDLYFSELPVGPSDGLCNYSLMSIGCWGRRYDPTDWNKNYNDPYAAQRGHVPSHLDPWCKIKCGFVTPELVVSDWDGNISSISDTVTDSKYNIIKVMSKADPKQYFLIENRQLAGFDKGLEELNAWSKYPYENIFNGGILIYHIDENVNYNHNNDAEMHLFMNIERSNNGDVYDQKPHIWAYLNKDGRNRFNHETAPNSNFHQAKSRGEKCSSLKDCHPQTVESGISIEVLDESSPSMRVRVNVDDEYKIAENGKTFSDIFPDINFCNAVIDILKKDDSIERNPNDVISTEDWLKILLIERLSLNDCNIEDLTGIQNFSKLQTLYCRNNKLTKLDLSKNPMLMNLSCSNNELTELDITKCEKLLYFHCENNLLKKLDVSGNTNLVQLYCFGNQLEELNLKNNFDLGTLHCYDNYMGDNYEVSIDKFDDFDKVFGKPESSRFKYSPQKTLGWKYECENLSAGGDITVSYDSLTVSDFDVILALYKDNRLINLSESNQGEKSASLVLPSEFESGNGWSVKAFVWDSVSSMLPLDGAFEKEL
jgi:M6 family metalloprotease-like protein